LLYSSGMLYTVAIPGSYALFKFKLTESMLLILGSSGCSVYT